MNSVNDYDSVHLPPPGSLIETSTRGTTKVGPRSLLKTLKIRGHGSSYTRQFYNGPFSHFRVCRPQLVFDCNDRYGPTFVPRLRNDELPKNSKFSSLWVV